jgi:hypothetical protein
VQASTDEQPHLAQSKRTSSGLLTFAGLAMATAARRERIAIVNFMLTLGCWFRRYASTVWFCGLLTQFSFLLACSRTDLYTFSSDLLD